MIKKLLMSVTISAACMSTVSAQPLPDYSGSFLCKLTASGGLKFNKDTQIWSGAIFNTSNETILMKITATGKTGSTQFNPVYGKYSVTFKDFGSSEKPSECVSNFNSDIFSKDVPVIDGRIDCNFFGSHYLVNLQTNRIQINFEGGYMDDWRENTDTPYVAVGVCEKVS